MPFDAPSAPVVLSTSEPGRRETLGGPTIPAKENAISASEYRINEDIRVPEVRLIGPDGQNVGVVAISQALQIAQQAGLDLVEVAPNSAPPVCRVLDYGKFLYEKNKKEREARKAQTKVEIKEIRMRPKTSEHHRSFKVRNARRWLTEGKKVRVRIRFRGQEITYPEIALNDLKRIAEELADVGMIEQAPMMEGRTMLMMLSPGRAK
ncbi:MAG TPA: translation initiation factor IF-3 [Anaerolineales bacterium]|nr:translation initiation factor IF-3 [Anaerolineales bacterium]